MIFLTGLNLKKVESVADEIRAGGKRQWRTAQGSVHPSCGQIGDPSARFRFEAAKVNALDEAAIDKHLNDMVAKAGSVDISFNAVGIPDRNILGVPLVELDVEQFSLPITAYTTSYFLTALLAARCMIPRKSGVIMTFQRPSGPKSVKSF
jgi:NAD(P)-dependent dehydrogenase (short-subunit alcohol dehydrogenase family)